MEAQFEKVIREIICGDTNKNPIFPIVSVENQLASNKHTGDCVFVGTTKRGNQRVVKRTTFISKRSGRSVRQTKNEIEHLRRIEHEAVVPLLDYWNDDHSVYIMFPHFEGDLFKWMDQKRDGCTPEETYIVYSRIASAVEYLHHVRIWHMDIKPENILIKNGDLRSIVLTDFGSSIGENELTGGVFCRCVGSLGFAAPEMFEKKPFEPSPCDYWSLGCVLLEMLWGWKGFDTIWLTCYRNRIEGASPNVVGALETFMDTIEESPIRSIVFQLLSLAPNDRLRYTDSIPFDDDIYEDPRRKELRGKECRLPHISPLTTIRMLC